VIMPPVKSQLALSPKQLPARAGGSDSFTEDRHRVGSPQLTWLAYRLPKLDELDAVDARTQNGRAG
jgi:hypothetical protein